MLEEIGTEKVEQEMEATRQSFKQAISIVGVQSKKSTFGYDNQVSNLEESDAQPPEDLSDNIADIVDQEEPASEDFGPKPMKLDENKTGLTKFKNIMGKSHVKDLALKQRARNFKNRFVRNQSKKFNLDNCSSYEDDLKEYHRNIDEQQKNVETMVLDPALIRDREIKSMVKNLAELEWKYIAFLLDRLAFLILLVVFVLAVILLLAHYPYEDQLQKHLENIHILPGNKTHTIYDSYVEANKKYSGKYTIPENYPR